MRHQFSIRWSRMWLKSTVDMYSWSNVISGSHDTKISYRVFMAVAYPVTSPVTLTVYLDITRIAIAKNLQVLKSFLTANTGLQNRLFSMISIYENTSKGILRKLLLVSTANELRNAILNSLCISVCVSLRTRQLYSHRTDICNFN